jgi:hypothetical protein
MNKQFYEIIERSGKCRDTEASLIRCGWFFWIYTPQWIVKFTLDEWSINQWMVGRSIIVNKPSP